MKRTILALALAGMAASPLAAQTVLRFSSFEPPVAFITSQILTPWVEEVSAASGGTLRVDMFAGGTLGRDPATQLNLVLNGVADIAWIVPGYTPGRFDQATVTELPFLVPDAESGSVAAARMLESGVWSGGGFDDVKVLGLFVTSPGHLASTRPINGLEDVAGVSIRGAGPVLLGTGAALGGTPVGGISGPGLAEALSRGVVGATLSEWNALQTFRVLDVVDHHVELPLGSVTLMVVMNRASYDRLPPEARAAIDAASGEAFARRFGQMFEGNNDAVRARARDDAQRVIRTPDADETAAWRAAVQPVIDAWIAARENGQHLYDRYVAELQAIAESR